MLFKLGKSCQSHKPSLSSIVPFIPLSHTYTSDPHYQADPHRGTHCISLSHSHSHSIYIIYALFGMLLILSTSHLLYITHQLSRYQYHTFALPENHQFATFYVLSLYITITNTNEFSTYSPSCIHTLPTSYICTYQKAPMRAGERERECMYQ